ncbi:uncharacterized protein LOC105227234 [Bactrocera dorsalis]|uniref:Uncharacterized protein LOC105227234 n=1 Tax=Bactrocera dorsalis TaxID=27457 RepID=A0A6I9V5X4_BACDO|nr:uncharacterized protein LOC105227234 [Bactrocera dorsalis]
MKYFCKFLIILLTINSLTKFINGHNEEDGSDDGKNYYEDAGEGEDYEDYDGEYDYGDVEYYDDSKENKMELPEDCISLKYLKLKRICDIGYPEVLGQNYEDMLVDVNEPYAVFQFPYEDTNRYFFTFQKSAIFDCQYLQVIDVRNYKCFNASDVGEDIVLTKGVLQCLNQPSSAIDLLLATCSSQLNESAVFTALHYSTLATLARSSTSGKERLRMEWCLHLWFVALLYILLATKK